MAGPFSIARVPAGLLELLSMKGPGKLPENLAPELRSIVNVTELYAADLRRSATAQFSAAAAGYNANVNSTIPAGEIWVVVNITVAFNGGAGTAAQFAPAYSSPNGIVQILAPYVTAAASEIPLAGAHFGFGQLVLPPGYSFGTHNRIATAVPLMFARCDYYRLLL